MLMKSSILNSILLIISVPILFPGCKKEDSEKINPYNGKTSALFNSDLIYGTMTDQEGNEYRTITIDTMTWMAENLRTTIYNDGTDIPNITDNTEWSNLTYGAYCNYDNTLNEDSIATYGRLYNWYAVETGKLAPEGWHVATDDEWWALTLYLGDRPNAGGSLKEAGTQHWITPNSGATNISGFTALPSGSRFGDGQFTGKNIAFRCWRSEKYLDKYGISWYLSYSYPYSAWAYYLKQFGFSVRCVKN
jgi:uncharacterized protein (TIGR02145 family)